MLLVELLLRYQFTCKAYLGIDRDNFSRPQSNTVCMLDYERRDVYRIAREFVITPARVRDRLPRESVQLVEQFERASLCA